MLLKLKRSLFGICIFPIFLILSACNDGGDDHVKSPSDSAKKPVMRCAP